MWLAATNGNRGGKKKSKRLGSLQQKLGANQSAVARQPPERGRAEFCLCAGARRCAPVGGRAMNSHGPPGTERPLVVVKRCPVAGEDEIEPFPAGPVARAGVVAPQRTVAGTLCR